MRESIPLLPLALSDTARTVTALIDMTPDGTATGPTDEGPRFGLSKNMPPGRSAGACLTG